MIKHIEHHMKNDLSFLSHFSHLGDLSLRPSCFSLLSTKDILGITKESCRCHSLLSSPTFGLSNRPSYWVSDLGLRRSPKAQKGG